MTREKVLAKLNTLGINISGETLRRWVNARLVPTPERGNSGRAGGRWSKYPVETPWEAFTAWHLLKDNSINKVAKIRINALPFIDNICIGELQELNVKLKEWKKEAAHINKEEILRDGISAGCEEMPCAEKFTENNKPIYVDSMIFEWLMLRIKAEYGISIQMPAKILIEYGGGRGKALLPKQPLKEFSGELKKIVSYKTAWQIKSIQEHTKDEIVIKDANTGAALVLQGLLQYLYRFDNSLW